VLRRIPSWEWLRMHIDPARSRTIVQAARVADSLDRLTPADADAKLRTMQGVGVWTSAEVRQRAFGDPDAVSFGDYHVAKDVGWALLGRPVDDDELAVPLDEWRPHRARVQAYVALARLGAPRHGPRMAVPTHLPSSVVG
jgi:3-methyladenine DNA glycosylase/8-oxoguanine DNA glycosylase